jgi:hypothetical protein
MVLCPALLRPETDCVGEDQQQTKITEPPSRQKGLYQITGLQLSKEHFKNKGKFVKGTGWVPDTMTDWSTDRRSEDIFDFDATVLVCIFH